MLAASSASSSSRLSKRSLATTRSSLSSAATTVCPCAEPSSSDSSPKKSPGPSTVTSAPSAPRTRTPPETTMYSPSAAVPCAKTCDPARQKRLAESPTMQSSVRSSRPARLGTARRAPTRLCVTRASIYPLHRLYWTPHEDLPDPAPHRPDHRHPLRRRAQSAGGDDGGGRGGH